MRALFGAVLALTVVAGPGGALAGGPSFNCKYAAKAAERAVCGDPSLSALDLELAGLYFRTQSDLPKGDARAVKKEQRDWLDDRDACGASYRCLDATYRTRIQELRNWLQ
jgi:uncharacterized protein